MRSNRPNYTSTPAGSAKALDQKPRPKRSKREFNQLMLLIFFIVLPVLGLLAVFFQPMRWLFMLAIAVALVVMWTLRAFLFPGRMIVTAVYGLALVFTLVTALNTRASTGIRQPGSGQTLLSTAVSVTPTPAFSNLYSTMGTSVPDGYYADASTSGDALADLPQMGISGGSADQSGADLGLTDVGVTGYMPEVKSGSEIALENFMERWRKGIIADMVDQTAPSWRASLGDEQPSKVLFWKFKQKPLIDWRQLAAPTGTDASTARTITVQADVSYYDNETRTYQYDALTLYENGNWYVDPDSLTSGVLVEQATPTPDPNATPTPSPEPTPTPTIPPKTKLYYNKDGGKYYHADNKCSSVNSKYLPLSGSFTYNQLNDSKYSKLEPCKVCNAPARPSK